MRWERDARRKRREAARAAATAAAAKPASVPPTDQVVVAPDDVIAPADLPMEQGKVWEQLAPFALAAGKLTPATAYRFRMLCYAVVWERELGTIAAGNPDHRGMRTQLAADLRAFGLSPEATVVSGEKPEDDFSEFDRPMSLIRGGRA